MSLRTETKTIDDLEVTVVQHGAMRASRLLARLARVVGPGLARLAKAASLESDAGPAIALALSQLDDQTHDSLVQDLLAGTTVVTLDDRGQRIALGLGNQASIDRAFNGRLMSLYRVIKFAAEVNYRDFLPGSGVPA